MLQLILGRAHSGKSRRMNERMRALAQVGERSLVLVPEQYSVEKEREILAALGNQAASFVEVINFQRLSDVVFRAAGGGAAEYIDRSGKLLVMARALDSVRGELRLYRAAAERPEFLQHLIAVADEFAGYGVRTEELLSLSTAESEPLASKLADLSLICETYRSMLSADYADPMERTALAAERLAEQEIFAETHIFIDAFQDFTPAQFDILARLCVQAKSVTAALCLDSVSGKSAAFHRTRKTAARLLRCAQDCGAQVRCEFCAPESEGISEGIAAVERILLSPEAAEEEPCAQGVRVACTGDIYDELDYVCREIRTLVRDEGMRYRDIAVVARQAAGYVNAASALFARYEIPFFMDKSSDVIQKPLPHFILSAIDVVTRGFAFEDLFGFLKTGLAPLEEEEIDRLENYAYAWNLQGKRAWTKPFVRHPDGYNRAFDEEASARLAELDALRERAVEPLLRFEEAFLHAGAVDKARAICALLTELAVPEKLEKQAEQLREDGYAVLASETEQLWGIVTEALSQMALLCENEIAPRRFRELLKLVISGYDVGTIPTSLDQVVIGSADMMRIGAARVVFVIGCNEGVFPCGQMDEGLLNDHDRAQLAAHEVTLAPGARERMMDENFYLYAALTAASERLYITYRQSETVGEQGGARPARVLERLLRRMPALRVEYTGLDSNVLHRIECRQTALSYLAENAGKETRFTEELRGYFTAHGEGERVQRLRADEPCRREYIGTRAQVKQLYGDRELSPTSLERYVKCKFSYFCHYGLRAKERKKNAFDALESGTFMHFVLERYAAQLARNEEMLQWDRARRDAEVRSIVRDYVREQLPDYEELGARFRFRLGRLCDILCAFIENLTCELRNSRFRPAAFEMEVGKEISPLVIEGGGARILVRGKIDRLDVYEQDGKRYIRIVDYKTGKKDFSYSEIYQGLGMQLLLYLFAAWSGGDRALGGEVVPAGCCYAPVRDEPIVVADPEITDEALEEMRRENARTSGLIIRDEEIWKALDKSEKYDFLPLVRDRSGKVDPEKSDTYTLEQLGKLRVYAESLLLRINEEIAEGEITINPFDDAAQDGLHSCQYCEMRPICRYDGKRTARREYPRFRRAEFWERIEGGEQDG